MWCCVAQAKRPGLALQATKSALDERRRTGRDPVNVTVVEAPDTFLSGQETAPDVAVLDPPRSGAGREVIDLLAAAGTPRIVHIGCEVASFARDIGLYRARGYAVDELRVFDAFPLTHHTECVALLTRQPASTK